MGKKEYNKAVDRKLIRRLYFYIRPYRWYVALAIVLTLTAAFLGTVRPKLTQIAVDDYIANKDLQGLLKIIGLLFLAQIGEFLLQVINTYITRWFGQGSLYSLRNGV